MRERRLPWLVGMPLMAAGAFAARAATYVCVPPAGGETGNEAAEHLQAGGRGIQWPLVLGVVAALVAVAAVGQAFALLKGRRGWSLSAWAFFWLPPLAFLGQEIVERLLHSEPGFGLQALTRIGVGLALQLPFALAALLVAHVCLAAVRRLAQAFGRAALLPRVKRATLPLPCGRSDRPPCTLLALGHPQRGPPISS